MTIRSLPSDQDATGRTFGDEELRLLNAVIESGRLNSTKGSFVTQLESTFAKLLGVKHCFACCSGTAAVHTAVAAFDPEPGDEFITSPITDFGGVAPILWQCCIPVFADVNSATGMITAKTVERVIDSRTRAIIVTHLLGNPAEVRAIVDLGRQHNIPVIEDCSQAYLARISGRSVGTFGSIGCFSLQQTKHVTTGEGGLVVTDDDALAHRIHQFINKSRDYSDPTPEHYFLSMNYRMTELQGAVGCAQTSRLPDVVKRRQSLAAQLDSRLKNLPGVQTATVQTDGTHSFWRYAIWIDPEVIPGGPNELAAILETNAIPCMPGYQKAAFDWVMFREQNTFGKSCYPFTLARRKALDYSSENFPGTSRCLRSILVIPWNERYTEADVDLIAQMIHAACDKLLAQSISGS